MSKNLDSFLAPLSSATTHKRADLGQDLVKYLSDPNNTIECSDISQIIEPIVPWISSSNFKVSQAGLEAITALITRMGHDFRGFTNTVIAPAIERLGDNKESVRNAAQALLLQLLQKDLYSGTAMADKLLPCFLSKNSSTRYEALIAFHNALNHGGGIQQLAGPKIIQAVARLLTDQSLNVREYSVEVMGTYYKHLGDKMRKDLMIKYQVPDYKVAPLLASFDEIKSSLGLEGAVGFPSISSIEQDAVDEAAAVSAAAAVVAAERKPKKPASTPAPKPTRVPGSTKLAGSSLMTPTTAAGAVDEDYFNKSFENVPPLQLFSSREVDDHMLKIRETISDPSQDWNKRVEALKKMRSLVIAGGANFDEFNQQLRVFIPPFQLSVKDLRSQVVREACVTIAYLSKTLGMRVEHFCVALVEALLNLIQNSAKIISSSGSTCIKYVLQFTHSYRLIPIITSSMTNKSKDIRRACCEFLYQILHTWSTHSLERHIANLQEAIKKGITDADSEARSEARKAYVGFRHHFREQADSLLHSLDASYQNMLSRELGTLSSSTSNPNLHQQGVSSLRAQSSTRSPHVAMTPRRVAVSASGGSLRSNSAIDLQAAQRAKARAQYAALARQKVGSGASLPRPKKLLAEPGSGTASVDRPGTGASGGAIERTGRTRSRVAGVTQSQPSSRSGSPSSRLSYSGQYYTSSHAADAQPIFSRSRRGSTGIPRSTGTSRETSPIRFTSMATSERFGKLRGRSSLSDRPPIQPVNRPVMAQKILQQSLEAESALADALNLEPSETSDAGVRVSPRKSSYRPFEDHSDDSETSSVCSERSFDSFRRPSDSFSWSGSQQRLYRDMWEPPSKDINEIIANCESTHWSDRKEGLVGLQSYLQAGNLLTPPELKRVTENFTKMFMDSHTKVFSLFLDTLNDLIISHRTDLNSWLYVLLTRLLNKLGADLLGSIQTKIHKSLEVVRSSFPSEVQMSTVLRFLCDATQTPNARVKTAACNYITKLAGVTDPSLAFPPPSPGQVKDTATAALTKMIGWTMGDSIKQGSELRRAAQEAILALFNLNTPQVTLRFAQLPKEYQEAAASLIQGRVRRSSSGGETLSSPPSPSPTSPSPAPNQRPPAPRYTPTTPLSHIDAENLNPEEVYRSLRRTTAEIQNYSYESGGKLDRDTTSQDSGISQMSAGGGDRLDTLEERMEDLSIRNHSARSTSTGRVLTVRDCNGIDTTDNGAQLDGFNIGGHNVDESEAMRKVVESLKSPVLDGDDANSQNCTVLTEAEKKVALAQLIRLIRDSSCVAIMDHFKSLLRVLLSQLGSNEPAVRALVLASLTEMMKKRALAESFNNYVELLVLKVLQASKDVTKEVQRNAEMCATTIATLLAPELVIRVLVPLISTGDYPVNLAAVKTLTKLVETRGRDPVSSYLTDLMPGLIQAYDNEESSVRKSAVFCMVALHSNVGEEELKPHLNALNGSKLKLLHLYIRRAQQGSSVPTSPKNQPSS